MRGQRRPWDLLRVRIPAASARRGPRRPRPGRALRRPILGGRSNRGGRTARSVVSLSGGARAIPTVFRVGHLLGRLVSERRGQRPPWDLLRAPASAASARPLPGGHRGGLARGTRSVSFLDGPTVRTAVPLTWGGRSFPGTLWAAHPPGAPAAGRGGRGLPRGSPGGALSALNGRHGGRAGSCPGDGIY